MNPFEPMTALVVEPGLTAMWFVVSSLTDAGFHVTVAENFPEARGLIDKHPPTVLVTDLRLGEYNGLHLVIRRNAASQATAAVVVSEVEDMVLQGEAERLGATFVILPTSSQELMAAVYRTVFRGTHDGVPIRPAFERRMIDRRASIPVLTAPSTGLPIPERRVLERRRAVGPAASPQAPLNG